MTERDVLILGAGPTGLGAAWRLAQEPGLRVQLLEAGDRPGGLARSEVDAAGFTWDLGGHVVFSHYPAFDQALDQAIGPEGWIHHRRDARVRLGGAWVPYPLQNHLGQLPPALREDCLAGLRARVPGPSPHFAAWLQASFGEGLVRHFLGPYNEKVWATPLHRMGVGWMAERVAVPDLAQIEAGLARAEAPAAWGPNASFRFPRQGGTGAIWAGLARGLPLALGARVTRLGPGGEVDTTAGRWRGRHILSTLPIDRLVELLDPAAPALRARAAGLVSTRTHVIGIGIDGPRPEGLEGWCWMYFSEPEYPFYRVTLFSNYAPANVPRPGAQWSLMAEVAESAWRPAPVGLVEQVEAGLVHAGLLPARGRVLSRWHRLLPQGYPVPTVDRDEILADLHGALAQRGVDSRGRFGAWRYEVSNQDHSFMMGLEWAERLLSGAPETVFAT